jgi:L-asparagine transporter-like permease
MFTLVWLVVLLSRVTLRQKDKNNMKSTHFQHIFKRLGHKIKIKTSPKY